MVTVKSDVLVRRACLDCVTTRFSDCIDLENTEENAFACWIVCAGCFGTGWAGLKFKVGTQKRDFISAYWILLQVHQSPSRHFLLVITFTASTTFFSTNRSQFFAPQLTVGSEVDCFPIVHVN